MHYCFNAPPLHASSHASSCACAAPLTVHTHLMCLRPFQSHGSTPLLLACKNNKLSTAKILLDHNARVNATTRLKATPLIAAASHGHAAVVRLLLTAGADREMRVSKHNARGVGI